jgi:HSP20 family protein
MANVLVRRSTPTPAPYTNEYEGFNKLMREFLRWDPFHEMAPIWPEERLAFTPAFEVKETKDGYVFKADIPGVKEQDLEITLTGNRLTVSGKRDSETQTKEETYFTYERSYGTFVRSFTLPEGADGEHIRAEMKEGVLTIQFPKLPEMQPKKIAVKAGDKTKAPRSETGQRASVRSRPLSIPTYGSSHRKVMPAFSRGRSDGTATVACR